MAQPILIDEKNLVAYFDKKDITDALIEKWRFKGNGYLVTEFKEENKKAVEENNNNLK